VNGFEMLLKKWNDGIQRGAQARLAREIGVDQTTVSRWSSGIPPSEDLRAKVAKILGTTVDALMASFGITMGDDVETSRGQTMHLPVPGTLSIQFPEPLRKRIEEEAERRLLTFEMAVVVLLGEFLGKATTATAGRKAGTIPVEDARVADPRAPGDKTSSGTPGSTDRRGAASPPHRK
jgi:transcriptional regulator with XRE-family HTH domain